MDMFQMRSLFTVVVVVIAVGLLYLTWKQYQQPAPYRVFRMTEKMIRAHQDSMILYFAAAAILIASVTLTLVCVIWVNDARIIFLPFIIGSTVALVLHLISARMIQSQFCRRPLPKEYKKTENLVM